MADQFPHLLYASKPKQAEIGTDMGVFGPQHACEMLPPPPRRFKMGYNWQSGDPLPSNNPYELTGRWVSNYNERLAASRGPPRT